MSEVKRFHAMFSIAVEEAEHGQFVLYSVYKDAERRIADWKTAWETEDAAVKKADERIAELETDLKLNASMLAKQCDLAREAEAERDGFRNGQAQIQFIADSLYSANNSMGKRLKELEALLQAANETTLF